MERIARRRRTAEQALGDLPLFNGCPARELARFDSLMTKLALPPSTVLTRESEPGHEFFIIADGRAHVRRGSQLVATVGRGSFVGEMALLDGGARSATVVAATDLEVYVLNAAEFRALLHGSPNVALNMLRSMSQRLRTQQNRARQV